MSKNSINKNIKRRLLSYRLILAILLILPGYSYSQNKGVLSGTVTDSSRKPLGFVTVRFFKQDNLQTPLQTTLSKDNGAFQFNKPDTGNYILTFTHTGFAEKKENITVKPGGDMRIDPVELSKATGVLKEVV